jgi:UMF1 family MFS transporter
MAHGTPGTSPIPRTRTMAHGTPGTSPPPLKGDKRTIRGWTMYDWANSVYSLTITSAVFPVFYMAVTHDAAGNDLVAREHGLPAESLYSYALSAGFLVVALIAPLLSGIADHTGTKKRFLQLFCYVGALSCAALAFFSMAHIWVGLFCVMMACVGFSGSLVFYDAFLPEIAAPGDHDRISARGYIMGYIGSMILLVINLLMVMRPGWFGIPDVNGLPARLTFITVALWWAGFAQFAFRVLPNGTVRRAPGRVVFNGYMELRKVWRELHRTRRLKRFLRAFFVLNMGIQTVMYLAVTFAKAEVKQLAPDGTVAPISDAALITSILLIQVLAAIGAFLFVHLSRRFGNVQALMIGCTVWVLLVVAAYRVQWAHEFYMLACGVGLVMGGSQAISRSTYAKFLPTTTDHASYFSFYDVSYYIGTVLGTFAFGLVAQITGDLRDAVIIIGGFFVAGWVLLSMVPAKEVPLVAAGE